MIAGVSQSEVQWKGLALGEPPSWSGHLPCQVSMLSLVKLPDSSGKSVIIIGVHWDSISKICKSLVPFCLEKKSTEAFYCRKFLFLDEIQGWSYLSSHIPEKNRCSTAPRNIFHHMSYAAYDVLLPRGWSGELAGKIKSLVCGPLHVDLRTLTRAKCSSTPPRHSLSGLKDITRESKNRGV